MGGTMSSKVTRKPIGNFFIKKALQLRLIKKIVIAALLSTLVSSGSLILVYYIKYQTVIVYQLEKLTQELSREHIVYLILPSLLVSTLVSILVSFGIGLYSSRKYAVPIYKLEQWATLLKNGKLSVLLRFREKEEMKELSDKCNQLAMEFRERFIQIKHLSDQLKEQDATAAVASELKKIISNLDLDKNPIEVTTGIYSVVVNHDHTQEAHYKAGTP
jgi:methyl-accepting chemotaxis protein